MISQVVSTFFSHAVDRTIQCFGFPHLISTRFCQEPVDHNQAVTIYCLEYSGYSGVVYLIDGRGGISQTPYQKVRVIPGKPQRHDSMSRVLQDKLFPNPPQIAIECLRLIDLKS